MICRYKTIRSSHQRCSIEMGVFNNFTKCTEKYLCQALFFDKVAGLRPATLLKKRLWHRCFPVNFVKFLRTLFLQNNSERLLPNYSVNDFDVPSLKTQLLFLPEIAQFYGLNSRMQLLEMVALFQKLDTIKRMLVADVIKLVKLILVIPAANAVSERSFSSLK